MKSTRVSVKILDASNLPSSSTSTLSPALLTANVWVGGLHEKVDIDDSTRTQTTFCKADMDSPRFDTDLIFPLSVECVGDILSGCVVVTLIDTPEEQGGGGEEPESSREHDSILGQVKVPFSTIFAKGKPLSKSIHLSPSFYPLLKTKGMPRKFSTAPKIRLSLSFLIGEGEDIPKLAKNCSTFTELAHEIKKVSTVTAIGGGRGRSTSPKRGTRGRSRSRTGGSRNRNKTSSSPQNLNTLERIVLASGASPDYRNREPRYPEPGLFENDELVGPIVPEEDDEPPDITRTATSSKSPFVEIDLEASPQRQNLMTPKPKKAKKPNPPSPSSRKAAAPPSPSSPRAPFQSSTSAVHGSIHKHQDSSTHSKRVAVAWKNHLLQCLVKLEDKDTLSRSLGEIHQIVQMMLPHQIQPFFYQLSRQPRTPWSLLTRRSILELVSYTCLIHPQATATTKSMNCIMTIILNAARGVEEALRDDCVAAMSSCIRYSFPNSAFYPSAKSVEDPNTSSSGLSALLEDMMGVFSEQSVTTKECVGSCIAVAIKPIDVVIPVTISGNVRNMEDLRHALRPTKIPIPKDTVIISNRMAMMFIRSRRSILAMHSALSSAILPSSFKVEPFTKLEAYYLNQAGRRHIAALAVNSSTLVNDIVAAMGRSTPGSGSDTMLYRCCSNLAEIGHTHKAKHPGVLESLASGAPYLVNKAIQVLNSKNKRHWKEKLEAIVCLMWLCRTSCKQDYIVGRYQAFANAVNKAKAGVKAVREACVACMSELEGLRARVIAENRDGGDGDGEEDEQLQLDLHDIEEPPPIKFEPDYEPDLGNDEPEEEDDDDSVANPEGCNKAAKEAREVEENALKDVIKRGRKKYNYQRKAGGVRSPRESASGSATATVRLLKELGNKSVAMQRSLDDLAQVTKDKMENIGKRVKEIEVEVKHGAAGGGGGAAGQRQMQQQQHMQMQQRLQEPTEKEKFMMRKGVDVRGGGSVSVWREVQWLLHCGELETAYQVALGENNDGLLLRLMNETGVVCEKLSGTTNNKLFGSLSESLTNGKHEDYILPWIFGCVKADMVNQLQGWVRDSLSRALFEMISDPDEKGVLAAKLHPKIAIS